MPFTIAHATKVLNSLDNWGDWTEKSVRRLAHGKDTITQKDLKGYISIIYPGASHEMFRGQIIDHLHRPPE